MDKENIRFYVADIKRIKYLPEEEKQPEYDKLISEGRFYDRNETVDIYSRGDFEQHTLSNFCRSNFIFDGVRIRTMEGFLQALKNPFEDAQVRICNYRGKRAKRKGSGPKSFDGRTLHWKGVEYDRFSNDYTALLQRVYDARFEQDEKFREALKLSKGKKLIHTIGHTDPNETILTVDELTGILYELQKRING